MSARDVSISELFDELRKANLRAVEAEGKLEKAKDLAAKWEAIEAKPAGIYPEAYAYADGVESGFERAAEDLRELLGGAAS